MSGTPRACRYIYGELASSGTEIRVLGIFVRGLACAYPEERWALSNCRGGGAMSGCRIPRLAGCFQRFARAGGVFSALTFSNRLALATMPPPVRPDPPVHPRQQRVGRDRQQEGPEEERRVAVEVGDLAADRGKERARQGVQRREQGVLRRGLALVTDAHQERQKRGRDETRAERFPHRHSVE